MSKFRGSGGGPTHYEVLGLSENCTQEEIKSAFFNLSKKYHPDTNSSDSSLHKKFVKINEAYSVLRGVDSRKSYDSELKQTRNDNSYGRRPRYQNNQRSYTYDSDEFKQQNRQEGSYYEPNKNPNSSGTYTRTTTTWSFGPRGWTRTSYTETNYNNGFQGMPHKKPNYRLVGVGIAFIILGYLLNKF